MDSFECTTGVGTRLGSIDSFHEAAMGAPEFIPTVRSATRLFGCVIVMISGCAHLESDPTLHIAAYRASVQAGSPQIVCFGDERHYWHGWRAGYYDVANGGLGILPALPPERYWKTALHPHRRQGQVDLWYQGFADGLAQASGDGWPSGFEIPTRTIGCTNSDQGAFIDEHEEDDFDTQESLQDEQLPGPSLSSRAHRSRVATMNQHSVRGPSAEQVLESERKAGAGGRQNTHHVPSGSSGSNDSNLLARLRAQYYD